MSFLYDEIVSSPTFRFLVGRQRKPMTIHTALLAAQSPVLRALVSGAWEEGQTGEALWESVTEETFTLFAQFLYTGDYKPPFHVVKTSRQYSNVDANESADESYAGLEAEMASEERTRDIRSSHAYIADNLFSFHAQPLGGPANRRAVERHATQNDHPAWGPNSGIPTKCFSHTQHTWNTPPPTPLPPNLDHGATPSKNPSSPSIPAPNTPLTTTTRPCSSTTHAYTSSLKPMISRPLKPPL